MIALVVFLCVLAYIAFGVATVAVMRFKSWFFWDGETNLFEFALVILGWPVIVALGAMFGLLAGLGWVAERLTDWVVR